MIKVMTKGGTEKLLSAVIYPHSQVAARYLKLQIRHEANTPEDIQLTLAQAIDCMHGVLYYALHTCLRLVR